MEMDQRLIDCLEVALDYRLTTLAIRFPNALFNLSNGLLFWQDAAEREETGLHDGIDASSHACLASNLVRIDHIEMQLLLRDGLLDFKRQMLPDVLWSIEAVEEEDPALAGILEDIKALQEVRTDGRLQSSPDQRRSDKERG